MRLPASSTNRNFPKPLDPSTVRSIFNVLPDMEPAYNALDEICYSLHDDQKLGAFALAFRNISQIDEGSIGKSFAGKVQKIYLNHSDMIISAVVIQYQNQIVESILKKFNTNLQNETLKKQIEQEFRRGLFNRFVQLHSTFPHFALSRALGIPIANVPNMCFDQNADFEQANPLTKHPLYKVLS